MSRPTTNILSGLFFILIAIVFSVTAARTLNIGTFGLMGPGLFPILVSTLLAGLGVAIIVTNWGLPEENKNRPVRWRAVLFVTAAPIVFAFSIRSIGMVPALALATTMAVAASRKISLAKGAMIVVGMTIFCVAVFSYGIGLTAQLFVWPPQPF